MINYYYSCPICTRVVNRFRDMRYHLSRCSNTPSTDYDIDDCKSEGMMKTESCDDCGMRFLDTEKHYQHSVCEPDDDEVDEEGGSGYAKHGSYTTYNQRHGPHFQEAREVVLERDNYVCQALGCKISNEEHRERSDLWPPNEASTFTISATRSILTMPRKLMKKIT